MDTTSRIAIRMCAVSLFVAASSFADSMTNQLPTIAEIDAEIASIANLRGAKTLWREFEATSGRIKKFQDSAPSQEVFRVQWHVVSNMFSECYTSAAVTNENQVDYYGIREMVRHHITMYRLFHADTNAVMYVADCISNALPADLSRETAVVQAGINGKTNFFDRRDGRRGNPALERFKLCQARQGGASHEIPQASVSLHAPAA